MASQTSRQNKSKSKSTAKSKSEQPDKAAETAQETATQPEPTGDDPNALGTDPKLAVSTSRQFAGWLSEMKGSIAFSTYQAGMLMFISVNEDGGLYLFNRHLNRLMGMTRSGNTLYAASLFQIHRFENALLPEQVSADGHDAVFVPQVSYTTGDIDVHDMGVLQDGRPVFVSTLFSCLATVSDAHSLQPIWTPPWISRLAAEDRCHLNGLAMRDGLPAYITSVSTSDEADGWRHKRTNGGVVVDVATGETVCDGLSMPHSPRLYRDRLWLHDSGTGRFGYVDLEKGKFEPICFCPGYLRGLSFFGSHAVMGLSLPRESDSMSGLALDKILKEKDMEPRCAIYVVNIETGDIEHWVKLEGIIEELYDVIALEGLRRPMAFGFKNDEIHRVLSLPDNGAVPTLQLD